MKKRVVVTGFGFVSSIGNTPDVAVDSMKSLRSGIVATEKMEGMRSRIWGEPHPCVAPETFPIPRGFFSSRGILWTYCSTLDALKMSNMEKKFYENNPRAGIIIGSGGGEPGLIAEAARRIDDGKRLHPRYVPLTMHSSLTAILGTVLKVRGVNYGITSACATSSHCIGQAMRYIQNGEQDIIFTGGGENLERLSATFFDAMMALSKKYNQTPDKASRPFDKNRDGFIISGGSGILILEELEHARERGANIYGEIIGHAATSDGYDIVKPSGEGATRCMEGCIKDAGGRTPNYINAHGTSTPAGDTEEIKAIERCFGSEKMPSISSTKSLTGHALGASGALEVIFSLLMMNNDFVCGSANFYEPEEGINTSSVLKESKPMKIETCLSNSFGFGGTNACLMMGHPETI